MATERSYSQDKYVVLHGPQAVHYFHIPPGGGFITGQPDIEEYDTPEEAATKLVELGFTELNDYEEFTPFLVNQHLTEGGDVTSPDLWPENDSGIPDWSPDGTYPKYTFVRHNRKIWLHVSDRQGEPDEVYTIDPIDGDWIPEDVIQK